ncbi:MAG: alpha/beta hydrolase [Bacteroidetes bacterium]|nr:MAG: alpha/beta hydrolase [Bacteroidota bacterium]
MKKIFYIAAILLVGSIVITYVFYLSYRNERLGELESRSQLIQTSHGPIEYQLSGESGPVILYLHGIPGGYDAGFSWPGYRVLSVSRSGYLRTPITVGRTPDEQARAYAALLDSLGIGSVVVMGASGGGPPAIAFTAMYPKRTLGFLGLFPISQSWHFLYEAPSFSRSDFWLWAVANASNNSFGRKVLGLFVPGEGAKRWISSGLSSLEEVWPPSLRANGLSNDIAQYKSLDLLNGREITVPTLIIHGTADIDVPYSQSEILTANISGSVLHPIEGGTHQMFSTRSEEIIPVMAEFLITVTHSLQE